MATAQAQLLQQHIGGLIVLDVLQLLAVLTLPSSHCIETPPIIPILGSNPFLQLVVKHGPVVHLAKLRNI